MTAIIKRWIVASLEALCAISHNNLAQRVPGLRGCRISLLSADLDLRWKTGHWKEPEQNGSKEEGTR